MLSKDQINCLKSIESASDKVISPLQDLEDTLHPVINYLIIPLFAFANAGIVLSGIELSSLFTGISLAVFVGLLFGKFVGIFFSSWLIIKLKIVPMPTHSTWKSLAAVSVLAGLGFTVSLFIANLSFGNMGRLFEFYRFGRANKRNQIGRCDQHQNRYKHAADVQP